jgi:SNF family Na+-dependent transporter
VFSRPLAFDHLPYGRLFVTLFLALLLLAAWTSAISLAEPVMVWLSERFGMSLRNSALLCGIGAWALGVVTILSFNNWAFSFKFLGIVKKMGFFDVMQIAARCCRFRHSDRAVRWLGAEARDHARSVAHTAVMAFPRGCG